MTEYIARGNKVSLLVDGKEVITLEKAVYTTAMLLYEDYRCMKKGIKNDFGREITVDDLKPDVEVLNALSHAYEALR